nr:hypothetical protein [Pedobacter kyonggii]
MKKLDLKFGNSGLELTREQMKMVSGGGNLSVGPYTCDCYDEDGYQTGSFDTIDPFEPINWPRCSDFFNSSSIKCHD